MLNQLELQLCIVSQLPEHEEERGRIEKYFLNTKTVRYEDFSGHLVENPLEDNENRNRFLLQTAKRYIENPEAFPSNLYDPKRYLKELAFGRLHRLRDKVDSTEAELLYSDSCKLSEKEKFLFEKRFEYIRTQFRIWEEALNTDAVKITQLQLSFNKSNYPTINRTPWQPEAKSVPPSIFFQLADKISPERQREVEEVKGEPIEFRQIWLNPDEDIPFILEALKRLDFIDEKEIWRWNTGIDNPMGVIDAIARESNRFSDFSGEHRVRVFGRRFKFPKPEKRFERKKGTYFATYNRMEEYLKNKR